jgi:hypothetical protein
LEFSAAYVYRPWSIVFANLIQPRLKPGAFGPIPMSLREFLTIVKTFVDWALTENGFPSIHRLLPPFSLHLLPVNGSID